MAKIESFEDLIAWQKARDLCDRVYTATRNERFSGDIDLRRQVRRAAVSALSNIAEGFERGRKTEFRHFLGIAKGSCGEVRAQLYVALDQKYIEKPVFDDLNFRAAEPAAVIADLRLSLSR